MERIAMNQEERDWLEWLKRAQDGVITQRQAAEKMGVSERWVRNLLVRMKTEGDEVVVHGLRGRASNRRIDEQTQARAMRVLKQPEWHDFGPTFASEQLAKRHNIEVSKETVRNWMMAAGLWKAQSAEARRGAFLAAAAERLRRTGAVGHVESRLAGRARRAGALPGADDRRCDQPELGTIRAARRDARKHGRAVGVRGTERADGGCVYGPGCDVHGDAAGGRKARSSDGRRIV